MRLHNAVVRIIKAASVRGWALRHADASGALERWMDLIEEAEWQNLAQLRAVIASADEVTVKSGRRVVVFNLGGNRYRLIAAVHYNTQIVYAMRFTTHAEYNKDKWKKVL
jgi:mRNA interferase HigB